MRVSMNVGYPFPGYRSPQKEWKNWEGALERCFKKVAGNGLRMENSVILTLEVTGPRRLPIPIASFRRVFGSLERIGLLENAERSIGCFEIRYLEDERLKYTTARITVEGRRRKDDVGIQS